MKMDKPQLNKNKGNAGKLKFDRNEALGTNGAKGSNGRSEYCFDEL